MTERRYREDEVRKIFQLATTDKIAPPATSPASGFTLADIQSIGLEVGIEPDRVAHAAASLDSVPAQQVRTFLGMPVEVGVNVPLARVMTDEQWEMLVAELRATFRAKGRVTTQGSFREWRNGNLHAVVEPTESGQRLRLGTRKGNAAAVNALGAAGILASIVSWVTHFLIIDPHDIVAPLIFGAAGIGAFLINKLRLPAWARERAAQMHHIAARIRSIMQRVEPTVE